MLRLLPATAAVGVTRNVRFPERVYRCHDMVWTERVLPAGAHEAKALKVRLIDSLGKVAGNVPPAEYGNVGFDGTWEDARHLLDPRQLQSMKPAKADAWGGALWYELAAGGGMVRVLRDARAELPPRVRSDDKALRVRKLMAAKDLAAPTLPWAALGSVRQKEHSDYLD